MEGCPSLATYSIGEQLTQAADAIAAHISEGHGHYDFEENRQLRDYARGLLQEPRTWSEKARSRWLLSEDRFDKLSNELTEIRRMLSRSIGTQHKTS